MQEVPAYAVGTPVPVVLTSNAVANDDSANSFDKFGSSVRVMYGALVGRVDEVGTGSQLPLEFLTSITPALSRKP